MVVQKWVFIPGIWNHVISFGTWYVYPLAATKHNTVIQIDSSDNNVLKNSQKHWHVQSLGWISHSYQT